MSINIATNNNLPWYKRFQKWLGRFQKWLGARFYVRNLGAE